MCKRVFCQELGEFGVALACREAIFVVGFMELTNYEQSNPKMRQSVTYYVACLYPLSIVVCIFWQLLLGYGYALQPDGEWQLLVI